MHKLPAKLVAVALLISTAAVSLATERTTSGPTLPPFAHPAPLTAPTVLAKKVTLNSTELAKYQQLAAQSQDLATGQAAGASSTTKTVLIVVGVVVVVVVVVALAVGVSGEAEIPLGGFGAQ